LNMLAAALTLLLISDGAHAETPLPVRIGNSMLIGSSLLPCFVLPTRQHHRGGRHVSG
jgi:hypothetical protein